LIVQQNFSDLYTAKILDLPVKSLFPCTIYRILKDSRCITIAR